MVMKSTDPKSFAPSSHVPVNPERIKMTKAEAIEDNNRLKEREARKEAAGRTFDVEEAEKATAKKEAKKKKK